MSYSPFTDVSDDPSPSIAQMRWRENTRYCILYRQDRKRSYRTLYFYIKEVLTRRDRCINRMDTFHSFYANTFVPLCRDLPRKEERALQICEKSNIQINCLFSEVEWFNYAQQRSELFLKVDQINYLCVPLTNNKWCWLRRKANLNKPFSDLMTEHSSYMDLI